MNSKEFFQTVERMRASQREYFRTRSGADCWEYIRRYAVSYCEIYDVEGIERTGCVFCGFGAQFNAGRFRVLYKRYPKLYCMAMNYTNNGYTLRHALRRMGVALPDEQRELF